MTLTDLCKEVIERSKDDWMDGNPCNCLELAKACLRMKEAIADTQEFYGPPKMSESVGTMGSRLRQIKNILDTASADVDKIVAGEG